MRPQLREQALHGVRHLHRVRARLPLHRQHDGPLPVVPACDLVVLHVVLDLAQVAEPHRRAVPVGDHDVAETLRVLQLAAGLERRRPVGSPQDAGGQVHVGRVDGRAHRLDRDAPRIQRLRIELNAHRVLLGAEHGHLRHACHHGDALRQRVLRVVVEQRQRQQLRHEREVQDGLVGRIHLLIARRDDAGRQRAQRLGNRGLNVLRRRVDVAVERELQRDRRAALVAG